MTREEILAMKPGPDMDAMVAEKVMGWIAWEEQRGEYTYVVFQKPGEREPYRNTQKWENAMKRYRIINFSEINHMKHIVAGLKDWSTDISAAWEVLEWLIKKHADTTLTHPWCVVANYDTFDWCQWQIKAEGDTAPEAICKAALLAVMDL